MNFFTKRSSFQRLIKRPSPALIATLILIFATPFASFSRGIEGLAASHTPRLDHSWAVKRMDGAFWGIAVGDVNGDGECEAILLERRRVRIGHLSSAGFKELMQCDLPGAALGAHVSTIDIDADARDEIAISASEEGLPASAILKLEGNSCRFLAKRVRVSLRVVNLPDEANEGALHRALVGQGWTSQAFFSGPVFEMRLEKGKLVSGAKVSLPRYVNIFQFAALNSVASMKRIASIKGYAHLEVSEGLGGKFKRMWRSPARFGGSPNLIEAPQRNTLGEELSETATFDIPPIIITEENSSRMFAVQNEIPLRGTIGKKLGISGSKIVGFIEDEAIGFIQKWETVEIPGCVADAVVQKADGKATGILALVQNECGLLHNPTQSQVIFFEVE